MAEKESKKMTEEEKIQWDNLYQFVKNEIMMYDSDQSLPSKFVLRLKGLTTGKLMENRSQNDMAAYSYDIVLYTFKLNKGKILSAISGMGFRDELSKFLYICAIVESDINNVYLRIKNAKKSIEKTKMINLDNVCNEGAEYKRKTEDKKVSKKIEGLW